MNVDCNLKRQVWIHDDDTKGNMGFWDVMSSYDDEVKGNFGSGDVTSAYDGDAKGI